MKNIKSPKLLLVSIFLTVVALLIFRPYVFSSVKQDESLLGEDANKNGIRDDIEAYIQNQYPKSEKKRAALSQLARDYQNAFSVYDDPEKLKLAAVEIRKTHWCIIGALGPEGGMSGVALMAELFNNQKRSIAGVNIESILWDNQGNDPKEEDEIKFCNFDISRMKN